eukprot:1149583-Pelagomonas_calceolata.AAC.1
MGQHPRNSMQTDMSSKQTTTPKGASDGTDKLHVHHQPHLWPACMWHAEQGCQVCPVQLSVQLKLAKMGCSRDLCSNENRGKQKQGANMQHCAGANKASDIQGRIKPHQLSSLARRKL